MVQYITEYSTVQYRVWYSTVQSIVQYSTVQYCRRERVTGRRSCRGAPSTSPGMWSSTPTTWGRSPGMNLLSPDWSMWQNTKLLLVSRIVDEHFSKALDQTTYSENKGIFSPSSLKCENGLELERELVRYPNEWEWVVTRLCLHFKMLPSPHLHSERDTFLAVLLQMAWLNVRGTITFAFYQFNCIPFLHKNPII